jgi:hypothetical protein
LPLHTVVVATVAVFFSLSADCGGSEATVGADGKALKPGSFCGATSLLTVSTGTLTSELMVACSVVVSFLVDFAAFIS